jgi:hypothetical protein
MKTKTWTVIANTGKQADLQSGLEKKAVQKPPHISAREFVRWLAPESRLMTILCNHYSSSEPPRAGAPTDFPQSYRTSIFLVS